MSYVTQYRWAGFILSPETAADWASRITGKTLHGRQLEPIIRTIDTKVKPFKARFAVLGDEWEDMEYIVITRSERLIGHKKGDPVPLFEEGEKEAMTRPLLEREGVTDYVFGTACNGYRVS